MIATDAPTPTSECERVPGDALEALVLEMAPWQRGRRRDDSVFDRFLPARHRLTFSNFWTPLQVAAQVARWIDEFQMDSVVDIGSGVGKFCISAALASRATFVGIEHRAELAGIARSFAEMLDLDARVTFIHAVFGEVPIPSAHCYYFFNPFGENLLQYPLDHSVDVSASRSLRDIVTAERLLQHAPPGTYVVTYNGFGGTLPASYQVLRAVADLPCALSLSRKR